MSDSTKSIVNNHLIVGIGGTGGKIIRDLRKSIAADPRTNLGVHFEFLFVDSSKELMSSEDPTWKVLGKSVQLGESQQLLIEGAGLGQLLEDINAYPSIAPWIGPLDVIQRIARSNVDSAQGGQRRKFGRFLFACNSRRFVSALQKRVEELRKKQNSTLLTFHVCVGLAGGTGGGSVVDVVSQIRKLYPHPENYRILVYALMPDAQPKSNWDSGNYHANGYAALSELNALATGAYRPHDLTGNGERMTLPATVFNGCYVFSNENEANVFVDVDSQLPTIVADFLYQKTLGLKWDNLRRAEDAENGNKDDERSVDGANRNERSKRFLTFGIKRLVVPEEEIKEYLTYNFAQQAANQFMHNNWVDGTGFVDEPRPFGFNEEVARSDTQNRWFLTDEHLTLSVGILKEDVANTKWKKISEFWSIVIPQHKQDIKGSFTKQKWLDELRRRCDQIYTEGYRAVGGVKRFYETKAKDKSELAKFMRNSIEKDLFGDWQNGQKSLGEVSKILGVLVRQIEEKLGQVDQRLAKLHEQEDEAAAHVSRVAQEWSNRRGVLATIGNVINDAEEKLFNSASEYLTQLYVCRTYHQGWLFGKKLLEEVNTQIVDLRTEVDRFFSTLSDATHFFKKENSARLVDEPNSKGSHKLKVFNRQAVDVVNRKLGTDESIQKQQTQLIRQRIVKMVGEVNQTFSALNRRIDAVAVRDVLAEVSEESVIAAHSSIGTEVVRVMNVNIVEKLYDELAANDEERVRFVKTAIAQSGVYATFDEEEERKQGPGTDLENKHLKTSALFLPECQEREQFSRRLEQLFRDNQLVSSLDVIREGVRSNEITLIRVDSLFPLRFVRSLKFLKRKYDERRNTSVDNAVLLHGEGDGLNWDCIFIKSSKEIVGEKRHVVVLARALEILKDRTSTATGKKETVLSYADEDGLEQEDVLGKSFLEIADSLSPLVLGRIERLVEGTIRSKEYKHEDTRKELFKKAVGVINEVKEVRGNDLQDEIYKKYAATAKPLKTMLQLDA